MNFSVREEAARRVWREMTARYMQAGRYYHNLDHIKSVLRTAAELQNLAQDYPAVQLAAWFHDVVYDTRAADNEAQSAAYAAARLAEMGLPQATIDRVSRLILATAGHTNPDNDPDTAVLLDADLAVLGSDSAVYAAYSAAIRQEYGWVPEPVYREKRAEALRGFLERPRLYHTPPLYQQLEAGARRNMTAEIARLSNTGF